MKSTIQKSRRRRKLQSKKKVILFFGCIVIIVPAVLLSFLVVKNYTTPLYISPLALVRAVNGIDEEAVFEQKLTKELKKTGIPFTNIDTMDGETYTVYLAEKREVLVASKKDLREQIASLQVIYNRLTMEGKQFRKLDLRFSKPVIVLNGKTNGVILKEVEVLPDQTQAQPDVTAAPDASDSAQSEQ